MPLPLPFSILRGLLLHVAVFLIVTVKVQHGARLSEYVSHFEALHYDPVPVHAEHLRHKRAAAHSDSVEDNADAVNLDHRVRVDIHSHGKRFRLALRRDHSVFHDNLRVVDAGENALHGADTSHVYEGTLLDDSSGHCFGSVRNGVFDGQIHTRHGVYFVERAQRYSDHAGLASDAPENATVHSVIYHESDIKDPYAHHKHAGGVPGCGASHSVQKWMDSIQTNAVTSDEDDVVKNKKDPAKKSKKPAAASTPIPIDNESPQFKYSAEANLESKTRAKRSLAQDNPSTRKTCSLYIQTDPLFWRHVRDQEPDDTKTEEEILSLIAQHVKAVNRIYADTEFDGKYKHNGYQFEVQRIKIHNDSQCKGGGADADQNQFCIPNIDVSNFLNLHSKSNHEEFCLAYVFTYRDFTGGTLGLAWVASASGASGGICETYKRYTENINGVHHTAKRSLNTGIITFVNYNARVPPKVSQLTLAHEIGHNFGSPHDYPMECRPGGVIGNYIMFASATSGDRDNNNKFSHCSKSNISAVLDAIVEGRKTNCFGESDGAFCGNKIVEEGEECDCGFDDHECAHDPCCYPRKSAALTEDENKANRCRRRPSAECSPSEGPCCDTRTCRFTRQSGRKAGVQCKADDECTEAAVCDGTQARCPVPGFKKDNVTECNEGTQVCQSGECKSSICLKYGLDSCFLTSETVSDKRELCQLACRLPGNNTCLSTRDLVAKGYLSGLRQGLSLRPGAPCDNFQGYCDVFLKCRKVDAEGPLVRLKNLLFNQETLLTIAQWVTEFWWAVLLMSIGFVIFMAIFIRCFAIHTPSSNPNLPKNLHFSETLRRPVRSLQQKHYRPASGGGGGVAPPPYPGRSGAAGGPGASGPGHGYGEGRGHYNRARTSSADPHPPAQASRASSSSREQPQRHRSEGNSRGASSSSSGPQRHSRIEMQPMR